MNLRTLIPYSLVAGLLYFCYVTSAAHRPKAGFHMWDDVPLNRWNAIVSHDAATGYLPNEGVINRFTKTQHGSWPEQLDCGARVFDIRAGPVTEEGLVFHHGPIVISYPFENALNETITWARNRDELIVLYLAKIVDSANTSNTFPSAMSEFMRIVTRYDVPLLQDCTLLRSLSVKKARTYFGKKSNGVIAIDETCVEMHFDPSVHCSSIVPFHSYCCYKENAYIPLNHLRSSLDIATRQYPKTLGYAQAHWQYDAESIVASRFWGGSLLLDEQLAHVNEQVAKWVASFNATSWIEVNNVCDAGNALYDALQRLRRTKELQAFDHAIQFIS